MFRVLWLTEALNDLAQIWINADPATRQAITQASNQLEQALQSNPLQEGESREGDERVAFFHPLGVSFSVDVAQLHVWNIR